MRRLAGVLLTITTLGIVACGGVGNSGAQLTSIAIGPPDSTLVEGLNATFTATGIYNSGQRADISSTVTWTSTNSSIASITSAGVATAKAPGGATITASLDGVSGATTLTVTAPTLVSIGVTPANLSLAAGLTHPFIATGVFSDNSSHDVTGSVVWSTSDTGIATVSNVSGSQGQATAIAKGTTVITATLNGISGNVTLTVTAATLTAIALTPPTLSFAVGLTHQFAATGSYTDKSTQDLTGQATWSSSAPAVASVGNQTGSFGLVTALQPGSAVLTATFGGVSGTASVAVNAVALASIGITPANASLAAGLTQQFTATAVYTDNSAHDVTTLALWSTDAPSIATISNAASYNGLAKALAAGSASVTATYDGVAGTTPLTVTPATLVSIGVTPATSIIAAGTTQQYTAIGTFSDNSTQSLTGSTTWTSSAGAVASISNAAGSNGLATSAGPGATTITATSGSVYASASLTVAATSMVSLAVTPSNPSIAADGNQQFTATATFADSSTQDLTAWATWSSANPLVASISNAPGFNGIASALGAGTSTITASFGSASGSTTLTVAAAVLESIAITPANPSIPDGNSQQFTATGTYSDGSTQDVTTTATWTSSDTTVATISNSGSIGVATSLAQGSTTISAAVGSISSSTTLTVSAVALVSLAVMPTTTRAISGANLQFTAVGTYSDGSTANLTTAVTWHSSATTVATISNAAGSDGLATTAGAGSDAITATAGGLTSPAATLTVGTYPRYAYVANNGDGTVSEFAISGASLSALTPATVAAGNGPQGIVIDPSGRYAYVVNNADNTLSQFAVGGGGVLSAMSPATVTTGAGPQAVAIDPSGQYVYVLNNAAGPNNTSGTVSQFAIGTQGALTPLSPATIATGNSPLSIGVDPTGRFVYVVNDSDATVSQYLIGAGGALTAMNPATVATCGLPQGIAIDPTGRYAYVACGLDTLAQFAIGGGGQLTDMNPASVSADSGPVAITIDPTGRYLYLATQNGVIDQYLVGASGALSAMSTPSVAAGTDPQAITLDPAGHFVYVANEGDDTVSVFPIASGGALNATNPAVIAVGSGPVSVTTAY